MLSKITYKDKNVSGIYKICSTINNKIYIGSAKSLYNRFWVHKTTLNKNSHNNKHLQRFYNKHGSKSLRISVVEYCIIEQLIEREQYYLDKLSPEFNILKNASNSMGYKHTKESINKMSKFRKGKQTTATLGGHKPETIEKIRILAKQRGIPKSCVEDMQTKIQRQRTLTDEQVYEIMEYLTKGITQMLISKLFNTSQRTVSRIKNGIGFYKDYWQAQEKRFNIVKNQMKLF